MKKLDRILSYIFPVRIEETSSSLNPVLNVDLYCGKYLLNSAHMNYSFGTLHMAFEKTFKKLNLDWSGINNALIAGFGTGSVASIIRQYKPECIITGLEPDPKILELGAKYFQTDTLKNVTLHETTAELFLEENKEQYDLIVIDVFIDAMVPEEVETEQFLSKVKQAMRPGALVIFNKVTYSKTSTEKIPLLKERFEKVFGNAEIMTIMRTGKMFVSGSPSN